MATVSRRPLVSRPLPLQLPSVVSPLRPPTRIVSSKRARSPDTAGDAQSNNGNPKRPRAGVITALADPSALAIREEERKEKERKRAERDAQKEEFRVKYTKAFPSWTFYFDLDILDPESASVRETLEGKVSRLGANVEDFFSNQVTHLITSQPVPSEDVSANKENLYKARSSQIKPGPLLKSPIKLRGRAAEDVSTQGSAYDIVQKATSFGIKIWSTTKLESVLERCVIPTAPTSSQSLSTQEALTAPLSRQRSLTRLLESERLHGTTTERDPTQKRHDYRYFSKSSYYLLVEDMRQELATITAMEYPVTKSRDGNEKGAWPVLYCHPFARGPFVEFDDREKRRYEKSLRADTEKEEREAKKVRMRQREQSRKTQVQLHVKKTGDLRRSVSMNNLHRRATHPDPGFELIDLDGDACDNQDSANASGYLASTGTGTYMAASGNSVGITSTTGTTSTANNALRSLQLPVSLREKLQQQVVTSRKFPAASGGKDPGKRSGTMGPPAGLPERPSGLLRKSRSTNTMRLPKREEGCKPGYCESCRQKFDDFKTHVRGRKHRKFAMDAANFVQLDCVLARVQRRTVQQVDAEQRRREAGCRGDRGSSHGFSEEDFFAPQDADETMRPCDVEAAWEEEGLERDL